MSFCIEVVPTILTCFALQKHIHYVGVVVGEGITLLQWVIQSIV